MVEPTVQTSQNNFDPHNLPPHSASFYNTARFASQLAKTLSVAVDNDTNRMKKSNEDLRAAINNNPV